MKDRWTDKVNYRVASLLKTNYFNQQYNQRFIKGQTLCKDQTNNKNISESKDTTEEEISTAQKDVSFT